MSVLITVKKRNRGGVRAYTHAVSLYALPCLIQSRPLTDANQQRISLPDDHLYRIAAKVEVATGLTLQDLRTRDRRRHLCMVRQVFCWLAVKNSIATKSVIGRFLGVDHSTVIHSENMVNNLLDIGDEDINKLIDTISRADGSGIKYA